jgi:hypothetical protein
VNINVFVPPAIDPDLGNTSGWLVRCKPENDCASLFSFSDTTRMYGSLDEAIADACIHAEECPNQHAVVAIANNDSFMPQIVEG